MEGGENVDIQKEFIAHINDSIRNLSCVDGKSHTGEKAQVIIPVPGEFSIDSIDLREINLDNVRISVLEWSECREKSGNVIFDRAMFQAGAVLYRVTGIIR